MFNYHRTNGILPYDEKRVHLKVPHPHGDYINASWITSTDRDIKFISAQSPTPKTVGHFLQMVQENNATVVVSLTTDFEQKDAKGRELGTKEINSSFS